MNVAPPRRPSRPSPDRPGAPDGRRPAAPPRHDERETSAGTWEATLLAGMDRVLRMSLGRPPAPARRPAERTRPAGPPRTPAPAAHGPGAGWIDRRLQKWRNAPPAARRTRTFEVALAVGVLLLVLGQGATGSSRSARSAGGPAETVEGVAVGLDRDGSIVLDNGLRVQMLGVTPPGAEDAPVVVQTAMRTLDDVVRGNRLAVEFDPLLPAAVQARGPNRVGYVWLVDEAGDRRGMLNALVLAYGFGRPVTAIGYRYRERFAEATRLAQSRRAGVWMGL